MSEMSSNEINMLVMVTGSVAAIKLPQLLDELNKLSNNKKPINVRVVTTEHGLHFFSFQQINQLVKVYRDCDEWDQWSQIGDEVIHIELRKWATIGLIAPLDANTCAKISNGICDNLLTCIVRAWDLNKPLVFAPAMNVHMWTHPITQINLNQLLSFGYIQIGPISKKLACGDVGIGAMAEVKDIVRKIQQLCNL
jgi:phosphopantothenoylcysteine decarboxylase